MKPYIGNENRILTFPVLSTVVFWLLLEHLHASEIWYGVYYTIFGILWIAAICSFFWQAIKGRKKAIITEDGKIEIK